MGVIDWGAALNTFGFPLTALALIIFTGMRGIWIWGYAAQQQLADKDAQLATLRSERDAERNRIIADAAAEVARLETEKAELWALLKQNLVLLDKSATVAGRAGDVAVTLAANSTKGNGT